MDQGNEIKNGTSYRVTNDQFDISGMGISRIGKHMLISKFARYENLGGGPGWKSTLFLWFVHYAARLFDKNDIIIEKIMKKYFNQ